MNLKIDFNFSVSLTSNPIIPSLCVYYYCALITFNFKEEVITFMDWQLNRKGFWDWNPYKYKYNNNYDVCIIIFKKKDYKKKNGLNNFIFLIFNHAVHSNSFWSYNQNFVISFQNSTHPNTQHVLIYSSKSRSESILFGFTKRFQLLINEYQKIWYEFVISI